MSGVPGRGRPSAAPVSTSVNAPAERARPRRVAEAASAFVSVARISGGVSYGRRRDGDDWRPATVGLAVKTGDRLYAARGGALELHTATWKAHLAAGAGLEVIGLEGAAKRFYVWGGPASFLVRRLQPGELFEVETPGVAVRFERAGRYRVEVDGDGGTRVAVEHGSARATAGGVSAPVRPGGVVRFDAAGRPGQEIPPLTRLDSPEPAEEELRRRARERVLPFRTRGSG